MSIQKLIQLKREDFTGKDTSLRQPCSVVDKFDEVLKNHITDLIDTFESHEIAVGLAAPQIGIQLKISVINPQKGKPRPHTVLINPKIISHNQPIEERFESCMSLPLFRGKVNRYTNIKISYQDEHGAHKTIKADGFLARIIQHEIDHLDGILYIDKMATLDALEPVEVPKFIE